MNTSWPFSIRAVLLYQSISAVEFDLLQDSNSHASRAGGAGAGDRDSREGTNDTLALTEASVGSPLGLVRMSRASIDVVLLGNDLPKCAEPLAIRDRRPASSFARTRVER